MGQALLFILLAGTGLVALRRPWIGVVAAYVFVILGPQHIWWWNFEGVRPFLLVTIPTLIGILFAMGRNELDFSFLKTKINLFLLILFIFITISYLFGPYVNGGPGPNFYSADWLYGNIWKAYLFYFMAAICITDEKKARYFSYVMIFSIIYLIYWANDQYLSGNNYGRLGGPRSLHGGHYTDENDFAMLFVMGLPFLYYFGYYCKKILYRYAVWLIIPFGWHAIFLTGSRGGLLGLAVTILVIAWRSPKKWIGFLMIPALFFAFQWQAGDLMKNRAATISEYETESSAATRLQAWDAAWGMMTTHPITGVGLTGMGPAFPVFSANKPRVAHNAFFQTGAESGILALLAYIGIFILALLALVKKTRFEAWQKGSSEDYYLYLLNEATLASLTGFAVCALFLSLNNNEIFFYLLLLANFFYVNKAAADNSSNSLSERKRT